MLIGLMLMALPTHSQTTSTNKSRVKTYIDAKGDTMVVMGYEDARTLLRDVLHYKYTDSLLVVYKLRDSLNTNMITLQKDVLLKLSEQKTNLEDMVINLEKVIINKDTEITIKDGIIKKQKREILKQKTFKFIGIAGAIILPIVVLIVK